jgi:hypothetical protein
MKEIMREIDSQIAHYRGLNHQCLEELYDVMDAPDERAPVEVEHNLSVRIRGIRRCVNYMNSNLQRITALKDLERRVRCKPEHQPELEHAA